MNIVVRGANWVGDAVMTIPALRGTSTDFPDSKITLHTRNWAQGIFQDADFIDELLTFQPEKSASENHSTNSQIFGAKKSLI